ncbi:FHIPEP family type III secretion protein, partial [Acinetobacter baumannii]
TALWLAGGLLGFMSLLPGVPFVPFVALAAMLAGLGYLTYQRARQAEAVAADTGAAPAPVAEEPISTALQIDLIRLELGYGLLSL